MGLSRRLLLGSSVLSAMTGGSCFCHAASVSSKTTAGSDSGCIVFAANSANSQESVPADGMHRHELGVKWVDADGAVGKVLDNLIELLGIDIDWIPDFRFYNDEGHANAFVIPKSPSRIRPEMAVGRTLLIDAISEYQENAGGALAGLFAHEMSHVFQIQNGWDTTLHPEIDALRSVRLIEAHADFMAGWCLPQLRFLKKMKSFGAVAQQFHSMGDKKFGKMSHHGTPYQRQAIISAGIVHGMMNPLDANNAADTAFLMMQEVFPHWFIEK